ncbi:redoxin domain-containing protein [Candidatus Uabimicrobium amorphum]|uniref:Uncharacterized protein n=1 Tax=Uabimicrobium amorphum TaxID=2596890 RepID=A0A5S9ILX0_UABAM|nr:redoxin domain-containing protein [Candidatus Uabimicrobium amorphum]BBM84289.1 hypothetical protein UABAM_02646 [Candidatus Uabimicrobium amorphum]
MKKTWLPFLGFALSFAICFSYIAYFVYNEQVRDNPWAITLGSFCAAAIAVYGAIFTMRSTTRRTLKIVNFTLAFLAILFPVLFTLFVVKLSYDLPDKKLALQGDKVAPAFTLLDSQKRKVSLKDFSGKNLLVVFYRGHW